MTLLRQSESLLDPAVVEKLNELIRLHDEAYDHAMLRDGCHKSSEGHVGIDLTDVFQRKDGVAPLTVRSVNVYSYVLGPSRQHYFDSLDEALRTVRGWHAQEMADDGE